MTNRPSDRAIAQAFLEPGETAWTRGYRQFVMKRAAEIDAEAVNAIHCQNGHSRICRASQRDGITCPHDSCDIDDGVRPTDAALQAARNAAAPDGAPEPYTSHTGATCIDWDDDPKNQLSIIVKDGRTTYAAFHHVHKVLGEAAGPEFMAALCRFSGAPDGAQAVEDHRLIYEAPSSEAIAKLIVELRDIEGTRGAIGGTQDIGDHYRERCATFLMLNHEAIVSALRASGGAQDAEDAARYRWLRDRALYFERQEDGDSREGTPYCVYGLDMGDATPTFGKELDAFVDECMPIDAAHAAGGGG